MKNPLCYLNCGILAIVLSIGTSSCTSESKNVSTTDAVISDSLSQVVQSDDPMTRLTEGNARFREGKALHQNQDIETVKKLAEGQHPKAIIVSCSDSRVSPEVVFDQGLGDIFSIRTAGNVIDDFELGSIEYAAEHLHTPLIVVMGHQHCGAIGALLEHADDDNVPGHIASIVKSLKEEAEEKEVLKSKGKDETHLSDDAVKANVVHGVKKLRSSKPILSELHNEGKIKIVGAIYNLETGKVEFLDL